MSQMTSITLLSAQNDVLDVCNSGHSIELIKDSTKDEFGEILNKETICFKSHPIRKSPFDRTTLNRIAWADKVDIIAYIAKKAIDIACVKIDQIKRYKRVKIYDTEYDLYKADLYSSFYNDFLYIIVGGRK